MRSLGGAFYFVLFKDDATGYRTMEFLSCKSEVQKTVKKYVRQTDRKLRTIRSDNDGEYIAKAVKNFIEDEGINNQWSLAYIPQQNDHVEREMRIDHRERAIDVQGTRFAERVVGGSNRRLCIELYCESVAR